MAQRVAASVLFSTLAASDHSWHAVLEESLAYLSALARAQGQPQVALSELQRLLASCELPVALIEPGAPQASILPPILAPALRPWCRRLHLALLQQPHAPARPPLVPSWQPLAAEAAPEPQSSCGGAWLWQLGPVVPGQNHGRVLALFMGHQALLAQAPATLRIVGLIASVTSLTYYLAHRQSLDTKAAAQVQQAHIRSETLGLQLQQAVRTIDSFTTLAAHELRTPLSALMLQTDSVGRLMRQTPLPTARIDHKVQAIHKQVERLHHLVEDLLDVSRLEEGRLVMRQEQVDVSAVATAVAGRLAEPFCRAGTKIVAEIAAGCVGLLDADRIDQVISNLLLNALKYGLGQPVRLSVFMRQPRIIVQVVDQGIGIDPSAHEHIFSRYGRAVSEKDFGGLGLGLWISRQVVRAMGGEVHLQSALHAGAQFTIELPTQPVAATPTAS